MGASRFAAVRDAGQLRLYVNGKEVAKSAKFDPRDYDLSNTQPLRIGNGTVDSFNGKLSDVRLYGRALTAEELADLAKRNR